jgi:uncharacterized membrane protein YphA (DoxX/SURF4 family)
MRARQVTSQFPPGHDHYGRPDAKDNNWLLLECLLGVPLALGLWTAAVTRLLCGALLMEGALKWQWWLADLPSWHYTAHIREHAFTNYAVAGGLLLMQSFGAGVFSFDSLLSDKKE